MHAVKGGNVQMSVLDNFDSWKNFLGERLNEAQTNGISNQAVSEIAYDVGNYLASNVDAKNDEEKVLRDLWNNADDKERHAIANIMVKMVQNEGTK